MTRIARGAGHALDEKVLERLTQRVQRDDGCSGRDELGEWFDVLDTWRGWADDVTGHAVDAGHYLAEEAPEEVATALIDFLDR